MSYEDNILTLFVLSRKKYLAYTTLKCRKKAKGWPEAIIIPSDCSWLKFHTRSHIKVSYKSLLLSFWKYSAHYAPAEIC